MSTTHNPHVTAVLLAAALLCTSPAVADSGGGAWGTVAVSAAHEDWRLGAFAQYRRVPDLGRRQAVGGVSIGRKVSDRITLTAAYSHYDNRFGTRHGAENRPWQQLQLAPIMIGNASVQLRTRLEQRIIEGRPDTAVELRQQVQLGVPLAAHTRVLLALEPFLRLRTSRPADDTGLAQVRATVLLDQRVNATLGLQAGYMLQHLRAGPGPDLTSHVALLQLQLRVR